MGIERLLEDLKGDKLVDKFKGCENSPNAAFRE